MSQRFGIWYPVQLLNFVFPSADSVTDKSMYTWYLLTDQGSKSAQEYSRRLPDRPDVTKVVYRGRHTIKQQWNFINFILNDLECNIMFYHIKMDEINWKANI